MSLRVATVPSVLSLTKRIDADAQHFQVRGTSERLDRALKGLDAAVKLDLQVLDVLSTENDVSCACLSQRVCP